MRRRTTPGAAGYALAVLVSVVATSVALAVKNASERDLTGIAEAVLVSSVAVTVFALPTAPVGVLVVHLCCRRVAAQWVHVLAAGAAGALTGLLLGGWVQTASGLAGPLGLALILGAATAAGRASVISLRGPVDIDFLEGRPAC